MPRPLLALTIAAWMASAGSAAAAPPPPPLPGHVGFFPSSQSPLTVGLQPKAIAVGKVDGDGFPDFVTANSGSNTVQPSTTMASVASLRASPTTSASIRGAS